MSARSEFRRVAPWVLCALSLGLMALANWLRWLVPDQTAHGDVDWLDGVVIAFGFAGIPVVGALIASRLPGNSYGWLWCMAGLSYALFDICRPLVRALGAPSWVAWTWEGVAYPALLGVLTFVFLLFPTGRLPSDRWRWVARAAVAGGLLLATAALLVPDPNDPTAVSPWALRGEVSRYVGVVAGGLVYGVFGLVVLAMSSLVFRFRRAGQAERRQLAWFVYAAVLNGVIIVLELDAVGLVPAGRVASVVSALGFALLPVAVGVAVFRYHLYEIDRIVSRTVSYGLLTAGLVGLYLLVVALLRPLLEPVTGSSTLAVAGSTLAVAAAFNPARKRLQAVVDRRFDRARYDAGRAVDAFAARLRDQVDLDQITTGLCETVDATVAPGRVAVWLRPPGRA